MLHESPSSPHQRLITAALHHLLLLPLMLAQMPPYLPNPHWMYLGPGQDVIGCAGASARWSVGGTVTPSHHRELLLGKHQKT